MKRLSGWAGFSTLVALAVILDQAIKALVEASLPLHQVVPVLPFLAWYRTYNEGIAFSLLSGFGDLGLIILSVVVVGFVLVLKAQTSKARTLAHLGFAFIIGGAIGNLIDRVLHGYVIDYVLVHAGRWSFAVFNLADAFITIGAALIILEELMAWQRSRAGGRSADNGDDAPGES
ncbi:signal peptidase II [Pseudohoeflea coraliihabitans]|uniref:Lipoprotein signal peptidase n=1 Tax=Pseudohoeflea coraliihabitans TaxID=2860393 RepID=A0ABS6WNX6_9HYPH|nr:signal peptidase II [Pseudohoeflea sp. DP4N28-3]MBW3097600.1 signal peptidase II [Pseudohoeflea sp. DP4N28-3]